LYVKFKGWILETYHGNEISEDKWKEIEDEDEKFDYMAVTMLEVSPENTLSMVEDNLILPGSGEISPVYSPLPYDV
jgi:hypothetical protein